MLFQFQVDGAWHEKMRSTLVALGKLSTTNTLGKTLVNV